MAIVDKSTVVFSVNFDDLHIVKNKAECRAYKRTVTEHVVLFKFKDGYTEEIENGMYKGIWSFKDYFPSIMAMSLGRVLAKDPHGVTHVLVMRFASKEALQTYLDDDYRIKISHTTIVPFFLGEYSVDFETEVDTDLSELFKEGEKFNRDTVEHVELFKFKDGTSTSEVEELLRIVNDLPQIRTDGVQLTSGSNYNQHEAFTHGVVIRLPSVEGLKGFTKDPAYVDMLKKANPNLEDYLSADFIVGESQEKIREDISTHASEFVRMPSSKDKATRTFESREDNIIAISTWMDF